jgi:hypothetical protein
LRTQSQEWFVNSWHSMAHLHFSRRRSVAYDARTYQRILSTFISVDSVQKEQEPVQKSKNLLVSLPRAPG